MANTIRFHDAGPTDYLSNYTGHFSFHLDAFTPPTGVTTFSEFDIIILDPDDPTMQWWFFVGPLTDEAIATISGGFSFDSNSPPAWADYWGGFKDRNLWSFATNPQIYTNAIGPYFFLLRDEPPYTIDPASAANWNTTPAPPFITSVSDGVNTYADGDPISYSHDFYLTATVDLNGWTIFGGTSYVSGAQVVGSERQPNLSGGTVESSLVRWPAYGPLHLHVGGYRASDFSEFSVTLNPTGNPRKVHACIEDEILASAPDLLWIPRDDNPVIADLSGHGRHGLIRSNIVDQLDANAYHEPEAKWSFSGTSSGTVSDSSSCVSGDIEVLVVSRFGTKDNSPSSATWAAGGTGWTIRSSHSYSTGHSGAGSGFVTVCVATRAAASSGSHSYTWPTCTPIGGTLLSSGEYFIFGFPSTYTYTETVYADSTTNSIAIGDVAFAATDHIAAVLLGSSQQRYNVSTDSDYYETYIVADAYLAQTFTGNLPSATTSVGWYVVISNPRTALEADQLINETPFCDAGCATVNKSISNAWIYLDPYSFETGLNAPAIATTSTWTIMAGFKIGIEDTTIDPDTDIWPENGRYTNGPLTIMNSLLVRWFEDPWFVHYDHPEWSRISGLSRGFFDRNQYDPIVDQWLIVAVTNEDIAYPDFAARAYINGTYITADTTLGPQDAFGQFGTVVVGRTSRLGFLATFPTALSTAEIKRISAHRCKNSGMKLLSHIAMD